MGLLLMTRFTLQEVVRRRLFLAVVLLSVLLLAAFALLLNAVINQYVVQAQAAQYASFSQWDTLGLGVLVSVPAAWLVYLLSGALTIFLTVNMISGEIEAGTFAVIIPKPLRRYEIVLGKWLAYALILSLYTAFLFFAFLLIIYWRTGYWPAQAINAFAMLDLAVLALLGLTTLGSALMPTVVNGAVVLILFISAPTASFVSSIAQFAALSQSVTPTPNDTLQNITTVMNLIIPTDALWHGASYYLLPSIALNLIGVGSAFASTPIISAQQVAEALLIWVVLYCIVLPALGVWRFQKRDL